MAGSGSIEYQARQAYRSIRSTNHLRQLTRVGFAAKGLVYLMVGVLAFMAASHRGGDTTDQRGVIERIAAQPFGDLALAVIGVGLLAYSGWRFITAISDAEGLGSGAKGLALRVGDFVSGIVYSAIGIFALQLLIGSNSGHQDPAKSLTARLLEAPGGQLFVIVLAVGVIIAGIYQVRKGWREDFTNDLRLREMNSDEKRWAIRAGKCGYISRGVVFIITGTFFWFAARHENAGEARGLDGALDTIAAQPFGQWMLALVAVGLASYGIYCMFEARYHKVRI